MASRRAIPTRLLEDELSPFIELEEDVQWLPLPADAGALQSWQLPAGWLSALTEKSSAAEQVAQLWHGLESLLPRTRAVLTKKLYGLSLLSTKERGVSLVYIFNDDGDLSAQRGYAPQPALPAVADRFPVDLRPLYRVHGGLVNFMSDDGGPLPIAEWETLVDPVSEKAGLVKIAVNGPDVFGFDISEDPVKAYAVWPDEEEVEVVDDTWAFLDELVAAPFEDE